MVNPVEISDLLTAGAMLSYVVSLMAFAIAAALPRLSVGGATPLKPVGAPAAAGVGPPAVPGFAVAPIGTGPDDARPGRRARPMTERAAGAALAVLVLAVALHALGLLARGVVAARPPLGTMYEFATASAFAAAAGFLILVRARPAARGLGPYLLLPVATVMGLAVVVLYEGPGQLVPALRSGWLAIHVSAAVITVGVLTVGVVASAMFLWATHHGGSQTVGGVSAQQLDTIARSAHKIAFPLWTFTVIAGAIWAEAAWGRFWGWDPKETCAFVTWVLYAAYLHARTTAGWSKRRFAGIAVTAYASMIFNFVAVNMWFSGLHSYAGR